MPSKSGKQHRLMAMVAHDPKAAKRLGIPQSVGRDYVEADKGRKFGDGKMKNVKKMNVGGMPSRANVGGASRGLDRAAAMSGRSMPVRGMKKGGKVSGSYRKAADGIASKGKTKGKMVKMAYGGKC